jgi:hypothetical protein
MAQIDELLELLNTLILSYVENTVTIDIETLTDVLTCLQDSQEKIKFLKLESQLQQEEIQQKNLRHSKLVLVQNNHLFKEDDDDDPDQQPIQEQLSETTSDSMQMKLNFLFPSQSSDIGKKLGTIST